MPRKIALPIAIIVWLASAAFMWATLMGVNFPVICGRVLAPWAYAAEKIVFFPTIWLTAPLDEWLETRHAGGAITIVSVIETAFLATIYSTIVYLLLRRRLIEALRNSARRFGWVALAVIAIMIGSSVWLRAQLSAADYGAPLTHQAPTVSVNIRTPLGSEQKIVTTAIRSLPVPDLESACIVAREGATPLLVSSKTNYIREPSFHTTLEYVMWRVFPDHLETLPNIPMEGVNSSPLGEPRCAYGPASEVRVVLPGSGAGQFGLLSLISPAITPSGLNLESAQVVGDFCAGFHFKDLQITRGAEVLATLPDFSDHNLNNAALTRTSDGILHVLATAVLIPHDNSSVVHHIRFDPKSKRLQGDDALMVRAKFTSTTTPRIARIGDAVDAYWHADGGSNAQPEDGVYAHRIGDHDTWHLISERAEFVVLEDADGNGGTLVAAATHPSESGVVRWFYRKDGKWFDVGQTDAKEKLYTLDNSGTEPFALWRGAAPGTVHAAFYALSHLVVEDLQLPQLR